MTGAGLRLKSDPDSVLSVVRSSVHDFDVALTSASFHLRRALELLQERCGHPDDDAMLHSVDGRQTAEIGILRNGIDH